MATMILTDQSLRDVVFALRITLGRADEDELPSPATRAHWQCVRQWLNEAEAFGSPAASEDDFVRLRAFPLSGTDLRELQVAVDQAERQRAARRAPLPVARSAPQMWVPQVPHESLARMTRSSILLATVLALSVAINITWLVLYHLSILVIPHLSLVLGINSLVTACTLLIGLLHHWHLLRHVRSMHWHLPHFAHHPHPHAR